MKIHTNKNTQVCQSRWKWGQFQTPNFPSSCSRGITVSMNRKCACRALYGSVPDLTLVMEICQSPEEQPEKMPMNDGAQIMARVGVFENVQWGLYEGNKWKEDEKRWRVALSHPARLSRDMESLETRRVPAKTPNSTSPTAGPRYYGSLFLTVTICFLHIRSIFNTNQSLQSVCWNLERLET